MVLILLTVCTNKMALIISGSNTTSMTSENVPGPQLRDFESKYLFRIYQLMASALAKLKDAYMCNLSFQEPSLIMELLIIENNLLI